MFELLHCPCSSDSKQNKTRQTMSQYLLRYVWIGPLSAPHKITSPVQRNKTGMIFGLKQMERTMYTTVHKQRNCWPWASLSVETGWHKQSWLLKERRTLSRRAGDTAALLPSLHISWEDQGKTYFQLKHKSNWEKLPLICIVFLLWFYHQQEQSKL